MKHIPSVLAGVAVGMVLGYYLDSRSGARRRALVRDKLVSARLGLAEFVEHKARQVADISRGVAATGRLDRRSTRAPETDEQLHERIRSRLGRLSSHPGAIHVEVDQGHVRLTGHVLASEIDSLLFEVRHMPGVQAVQNALAAHERPEHISALQGGAAATRPH